MKKILILFTVLFVSGCTFQVNTLEPQSTEALIVSTPTAISISTSTLEAVTPTLTPTQPPTPTDTASAVPPITTGPSDVSTIVPIVFVPNATYQTVVGNLADGSSQNYSLNAMGGQIMSISIFPTDPNFQGSFQLQVKGKDGTVLCPTPNRDCTFWRGALPSSQEYLAKVTAQGGGAYNMRVAIDPPGTVNQTFNYTDPQGRFSLSYPDDFAPALYRGAQVTRNPPDLTLQDIDTQQFTSTNLGEVYFLLDVSDDPQQVANCTQPLNFDQPETQLGESTINGITYTKSQGGGVGAGNIYEQIYYRAAHNGSCYEIAYFVHYGNIGN